MTESRLDLMAVYLWSEIFFEWQQGNIIDFTDDKEMPSVAYIKKEALDEMNALIDYDSSPRNVGSVIRKFLRENHTVFYVERELLRNNNNDEDAKVIDLIGQLLLLNGSYNNLADMMEALLLAM